MQRETTFLVKHVIISSSSINVGTFVLVKLSSSIFSGIPCMDLVFGSFFFRSSYGGEE